MQERRSFVLQHPCVCFIELGCGLFTAIAPPRTNIYLNSKVLSVHCFSLSFIILVVLSLLFSFIRLIFCRKVNLCTTQDLTFLPRITVGDVEKYAKDASGCDSIAKAYKFFAEPGYLHEVKCMYFNFQLQIFTMTYNKIDYLHKLQHDFDFSKLVCNWTLKQI